MFAVQARSSGSQFRLAVQARSSGSQFRLAVQARSSGSFLICVLVLRSCSEHERISEQYLRHSLVEIIYLSNKRQLIADKTFIGAICF